MLPLPRTMRRGAGLLGRPVLVDHSGPGGAVAHAAYQFPQAGACYS
jgi:hypothetical protein